MKSKSLLLCILALAGFAALYGQDQSTSISASNRAETPETWNHHSVFGYYLKPLNLTDAQKQQVKLYFSDNHPAFRTDLLNVLRTEQTIAAVIEQNPSDDATIRSLSANVASFKIDLVAQRAKFVAFLQSILSPEQKQTLATLKQVKDAKMQADINLLS
jgi:Spy/CpxP family protein refolding chaperone